MALARSTVIDKIEVFEDGVISVRRATYIEEDGVRVTDARYARASYYPGQDISFEAAKVRQIANIIWTAQVIAAYQAKVAAGA